LSEQRPHSLWLRLEQSRGLAAVLNLLLPGAGHVYWREWVFGVFIFLVTFMALVLLVVSLLFDIPAAARWVLYGLPVLFYAFTFVDLFRSVQRKSLKVLHSRTQVIVFLTVGLVYQVAAPIAPVNFALRNAPHLFIMENNSLSPLFRKGDVLKVSSLAYTIDFFFLDKPSVYALPERYDVVRYNDGPGRPRVALVIGLPGEQVEISEGVLTVDNVPAVGAAAFPFSGECPLTSVDGYSILVATLKLGAIEQLREVPLSDLIGKVSRIW
jgi:hypothetical protein